MSLAKKFRSMEASICKCRALTVMITVVFTGVPRSMLGATCVYVVSVSNVQKIIKDSRYLRQYSQEFGRDTTVKRIHNAADKKDNVKVRNFAPRRMERTPCFILTSQQVDPTVSPRR
jgi:hypothetical protein